MFPSSIVVGERISSGAFSLVFKCRFSHTKHSRELSGALKMAIVSDLPGVSRHRLEVDVLRNAYIIDDDVDKIPFDFLLDENVRMLKVVSSDDVLDELHISQQLQIIENCMAMKSLPILGVKFVHLVRKEEFKATSPGRVRSVGVKHDPRDPHSPFKALNFDEDVKSKGLFDGEEEEVEGEDENKGTSLFGESDEKKEESEDDDFFTSPEKYLIRRNTDEPKQMIETDFKPMSTMYNSDDPRFQPLPTQDEEIIETESSEGNGISQEGREKTTNDEGKQLFSSPSGELTPPGSTTKHLQYREPLTGRRIPPPTPGVGRQPPSTLLLAFFIFPEMEGNLSELLTQLRKKIKGTSRRINFELPIREDDDIQTTEKKEDEEEEEEEEKMDQYPFITISDKIRFWYEYLNTQNAIVSHFIHYDPKPENFLWRYRRERNMYEFYMSDFGVTSRSKGMERLVFNEAVTIFLRNIKDLAQSMCLHRDENGERRKIPQLSSLNDHIRNVEKYVSAQSSDCKKGIKKFFRIASEIISSQVEEIIQSNNPIGKKLILEMFKDGRFGEMVKKNYLDSKDG